MRQPRSSLPLVHAELREPPLQIIGEPRCAVVRLGQHDHAHAACLAVPNRLQERRLGLCRRGAKGFDDRGHVVGGAAAEERKSDVQMLARDKTDVRVRELGLLPRHEPVERVVGEPQAAEEP